MQPSMRHTLSAPMHAVGKSTNQRTLRSPQHHFTEATSATPAAGADAVVPAPSHSGSPHNWRAELRARADAVKASHPIYEVAAQLIPYLPVPRLTSRSICTLCPLHAERTPSFHVFLHTDTWYCFGCHQGGDVISLVEKLNRASFMEALTFLEGGQITARTAAVSPSRTASGPDRLPTSHTSHRPGMPGMFAPAQQLRSQVASAIHAPGPGRPSATPVDKDSDQRASLAHLPPSIDAADGGEVARRSSKGQAVLTLTTQVYAAALWEHSRPQRYLALRGISQEVAYSESIGYATGFDLVPALQQAHLPLEIAQTLGLITKRGGRWVEWLAGRLIFSERRTNGQTVWMTGRRLDDEDEQEAIGAIATGSARNESHLPVTQASRRGGHDQVPPMLPPASSGSRLSPKFPTAERRRAPKYLGLPLARRLGGAAQVWQQLAVVVVEGPMDYLALRQWRYAVCWTGGSGPPLDFLDWISHARIVYLAGDGDAAGIGHIHQLWPLVAERGCPVALPIGLDPGELGRSPDGHHIFATYLHAAARTWPLFQQLHRTQQAQQAQQLRHRMPNHSPAG